MPRRTAIPVYIESGARRVFAAAVEWPGWCRAAKTEGQALEALSAYAPRYAPVATRAGIALPEPFEVRVTERVPGTPTTDFGAPDRVLDSDTRALGPKELERLLSLLRAAWAVLDDVAAAAPATLRKGPRGGGRDRDRMIEHVLGAEQAYARKLGLRHPQARVGDRAGIDALRRDISDRCRSIATSGGATPWPVRYFIRRTAWHACDHLWEMEDRSVVA
jgi:hypothetical protein